MQVNVDLPKHIYCVFLKNECLKIIQVKKLLDKFEENLLIFYIMNFNYIYIYVLKTEFYIIQYMLNHVLLHQLDQMLNDQKLNLVCNVKCVLQLIELNIISLWANEKSCHLKSYFSFYCCPFFIVGIFFYVCQYFIIMFKPIWRLCQSMHIIGFKKNYL
jgi:hypothetical protein